jgi:hypothetical protein
MSGDKQMRSNVVYVLVVIGLIFVAPVYADMDETGGVVRDGKEVVAEASRSISLGLNLGFSFTDRRSDREQSHLRPSYLGGAYLSYRCMPWLSIQLESLYFENSWESGRGRFDVSYLAIPILLRYHMKPGSAVGSYLSVGLAPAFLIKAKSRGEDWSYLYEDFDLGVALGFGVALEHYENRLRLETRCTIGLKETQSSNSAKQTAYSLMIGYRLL